MGIWTRFAVYSLLIIAVVVVSVIWLDRTYQDSSFQPDGDSTTSTPGDDSEKPALPPIEASPSSGKPNAKGRLIFTPGTAKSHPVDGQPVGNEGDAQTTVDAQSRSLGLGEHDRNVVTGQTQDDSGVIYYQTSQNYRDIPVFGARSVLIVENGRAVELYGSWITELDLDVEPTYGVEEAIGMALEAEGATQAVVFELVVNDGLVIFPTAERAHLAWKVIVEYPIRPVAGGGEALLVDAHGPEILLRNDLVQP